MNRNHPILLTIGLGIVVVLLAACNPAADVTPLSPTATLASTPTLLLPTPLPAEVAPLHLGWVWSTAERALWPRVTVDDSGTFYLADQAGALHAVTAPGAELWSAAGDCGDAYPPVLSPDADRLYFVGVADVPQVCALDVDGNLLWKAAVKDLAQAVPVLAPDGSLHLRTDTGMVHISPDGAATRYTLPTELTSPLSSSDMPPVIDGGGNAYFALEQTGNVLVLSPAYETSAECEVGEIRSGVVAQGDEGFFIAVEPGEIVSYDASCRERWRYRVSEDEGEDVGLALAAGQDDVLYAGGPGGLLLALGRDGQPLWRNEMKAGAPEIVSLAIGADGTIAAAGDRPVSVLAYNRAGTPLLAQRVYGVEDTGVPAPVPGGGIAQVHEGRLNVYTTDPALVVEVPTPQPTPDSAAAAEAEIAQFMRDMIVTEDIEGTLQYIEETDWYGTGPTDNVIVWRSVVEAEPSVSVTPTVPFSEKVPQLDEDHPRKVWTYGSGKLVEIAADPEQMLAAIAAYRETHIDKETDQNIFAWGFYEFGIVSLDASRQKAEVYRSASCGPLCGSGYLLTIERAPDGRWFVSDSVHLWQS